MKKYIILISILLISIIIILHTANNYSRTKKNLNKDVLNSEKVEFYNVLEKNVSIEDIYVDLVCDGISQKIYLNELKTSLIDSKNITASPEFEIIPTNIKLEDKNHSISIKISKIKIKNAIEKFNQMIKTDLEESDIVVEDDTVYYYTGKIGKEINIDETYNNIIANIKNLKNTSINIDVTYIKPKKLEISDLLKKLNKNAQEPSYKLVDGKLQVLPPIKGIKISETELKNVLGNINFQYDKKFIIPVEYVEPKYSIEEAESLVFKDVLSNQSTVIDSTIASRINNIQLISKLLNEIIILPGDQFSFNKTTGPLTKNRGFEKNESTYYGELTQGIGNGVCQAVTTLHNAVLLTDLKIVSRKSQTYIPTYAIPGTDAAVHYPNTDYIFENSTNFPIKILSCITNDENICVKIIGTNELNKKISIFQFPYNEIKPTDKIIYNDDVEEKYQVSEGISGYTIDIIRTIMIDNIVTNNTLLYKSSYQPYPNIYYTDDITEANYIEKN